MPKNTRFGDIPTAAKQVLDAYDAGRQIAPLSDSDPSFDLAAAYRMAGEIRDLRLARGDEITGRKIGFTNRQIWPIYGVSGPMWGWMYQSTLHPMPADGRIPLPNLPEPRIEPEIAFHFSRSPAPGMSVAEIADCIDWAAHGVEIVVSLFPDWRLTISDAIAGFGMHGGYWYGPPVPMTDVMASGRDALESFTLSLTGPGETHQGHARDVLDGPLHAVRFLLNEIAHMPGAPQIQPGEIVTTGTLTDARPVAPGQTWETRLKGVALPGLSVEFT